MIVNAKAMTDYVMSQTERIFLPFTISDGRHGDILRCEHCGRGAYLSDAETCKGCGVPLAIEQVARQKRGGDGTGLLG